MDLIKYLYLLLFTNVLGIVVSTVSEKSSNINKNKNKIGSHNYMKLKIVLKSQIVFAYIYKRLTHKIKSSNRCSGLITKLGNSDNWVY